MPVLCCRGRPARVPEAGAGRDPARQRRGARRRWRWVQETGMRQILVVTGFVLLGALTTFLVILLML